MLMNKLVSEIRFQVAFKKFRVFNYSNEVTAELSKKILLVACHKLKSQ